MRKIWKRLVRLWIFKWPVFWWSTRGKNAIFNSSNEARKFNKSTDYRSDYFDHFRNT
jgi:hypothetical protein